MVADYLDLGDVVLLIVLILAIAPTFGSYLGRVYLNRAAFGDRLLAPVERMLYRLLGVSPRQSMTAREYIIALLLTSLVLVVWVYALLTLQGSFGGSHPAVPSMSWDLGLHSAASFVTNTDFIHFVPETQVGLGAALLGLQVAMFLAAATGLSVVAAFVRGFVRDDGTIGNFYVDMVRSLTRVLVPLSLLGSLVLVLLGLPETFQTSVTVHPLGGGTASIPLGPVASYQAVSLLGGAGGGWYAASAGHPFANPSAASSLFETGLMMLLPLSFPFAFARIVRRPGEGLPFVATILVVLFLALGVFLAVESSASGVLAHSSLASNPSLSLSGAYPVGKETRFSLPETAVFEVVSVYANVGQTSVAIGSLSPVSQLVLLFGMFTQSTPGGAGSGFGTLLIFAVLAVFLGGLMVGRTPEYLGKKVGLDQVKWGAAVLLLHPFLILVPLAASILGGFVPSSSGTVGQHAYGFTVVLYEFTSEAANNGSAMGPISDNTPFFNLVGAAVMLLGRLFPLIAMIKIGAHFAGEGALPPGPGTLRTRSATFSVYLLLFVVVVAGLLFLPVLALGPLAQLGG